MGPLYVIAVISNPVRFHKRGALFKQFADHVESNPNARLIRVELAFGERPFALTEAGNPLHVQLRAGPESEIWVKESLINIAFRRLYDVAPDWRYAMWSDADLEFTRPAWATEAMEQLQHFAVIQPWSHAIDMGPYHAPIGYAWSFCYSYVHGQADAARNGKHDALAFLDYAYCGKMVNDTKTFHPGYAWAIRREMWEKIGPLIDWVPLGSADHHMAWAFAGRLDKAIHGQACEAYRRRARAFQERCAKHLKHDIGYADGTVIHHWHGAKKNRFYVEREKTLAEIGFNPDTDITFNHQGLLIVTDHNLALRDAARRYFRARNEDSIDL